MAAPPSQPSETETTAPLATLKDPPSSSQPLKSPPTPTYASAESSNYYVSAKALLSDGSFEDALVTIEEGIESFKSDLLVSGMSEDDAALHESMAPFHYLYGTTLLYSIEESSDTQQIAQQQESSENPEEGAEDVPPEDELAWENLEIARTIVQRMIALPGASDKLKLDLAQIFMREGDLHKVNGRYENAIDDYESCLLHREGNAAMGPYDRKIADVHYNLGLSRLMLVAEANASGADEPTDDATRRSLAQHRAKSFHNFYNCGKTLSGQLAILCGMDAPGFISKCESAISNFKSTGEEEFDVDHPKMAGVKLRKLRESVAALVPPEEDALTFHDIRELLDEIQETIDEAETSEQGVREVADLKAEITAMVAGAVAEEESAEADGATTQIGFGSSEAAATTAAAQPLMAVKKKKRPTDDPSDPAKKPRSE